MKRRSTVSNPVRGTLKPAPVAGFIFKKAFRTQLRTALLEKTDTEMATLLPYKTAQLSTSNPQDWFVYFYYRDPSTHKFKRFKERHGLNNFRQLQMIAARYQKPVDEVRQEMAVQMMKEIDSQLRNGYNPFKQLPQIESEAHDQLLPAVEEVLKGIEKVSTTNRKETYRLMFSRFKKYVEAKGLQAYPPQHFTDAHAEQFQHFLQTDMKLAKKTVNATISHVGKLWDGLKDKVKSNPFRKVKPLTERDYIGLQKEEKEDQYEPLTSQELDMILSELKAQGKQNFITFLAFIYYAWMRPVEIARLKLSNIDLKAGVIRTTKGDTKNEKGGMVQIVPQLAKLLKSMHLEKVSRMDYYLFGTGFKPGPKQLDASRGVGYKDWNPVCEKLGIHKSMYALKHSGNIEYLLKNKGKIDLKWQQMQNRHSSAAMTERYCRKLGAYFIEVGDIKFRSF